MTWALAPCSPTMDVNRPAFVHPLDINSLKFADSCHAIHIVVDVDGDNMSGAGT